MENSFAYKWVIILFFSVVGIIFTLSVLYLVAGNVAPDTYWGRKMTLPKSGVAGPTRSVDKHLLELNRGKKIGNRAANLQNDHKGDGRMRCTVTESEFLGAETLIGLDHAGATGLCVCMPGLAMMAEGNEIDITFNDENLHVFGAAGQRLAG